MSLFPRMAEIVPEGSLGLAEITHFGVSEDESAFTAMRAAHKGAQEYVAPGRYARLRVNRELMMTDTNMERATNREVVRRARGRVLIAGLGLGMIVHPIAAKPGVSVTVIEKYRDVIDLVSPTLPSGVTVIEGDILTWRPERGTKYDTIYFDIWANVCSDNLDDIRVLKRAFRGRMTPGAWMGAWVEDILRMDRYR